MLSSSRTLVVYTFMAALMTVILIVPFYLFWDLPLAEAAHALKGSLWITVGKFISWFASKTVIQTVAFFALVAGALDAMLYGFGQRARMILLLALSTISAMLLGDELKWFFGRCRPPLFFEDGSYGFTWFSGEYLKNSFPSGHTLRAFSLATALYFVLPRKRYLHYLPLAVAVLAGISRVVVGKHYPSDVLFGLLIGVVCAVWAHFFLFRKE